MIIYSIRRKDGKKEIYIGKTHNLTERLYAHKNATNTKSKDNKLYKWLREVGWENTYSKIEKECEEKESDYWEQYYISFYEKEEYKMLNQQLTNNYSPHKNYNDKFEKREELYNFYLNTTFSISEIAYLFNVSISLVNKIIEEKGGGNRVSKLAPFIKEIQKQIMEGVPIRQLAKKYKVAKTSITNINTGITGYNPNFSYPLNQKVVEKIKKDSQFKSKV